MTRNYADLERELIDDLERRTGRDLAAWMSAIEAAGLADKNAVIDWLRPQGFTFANASWLERIHNNGGRPIYLDQPAAPRVPRLKPEPVRKPGPLAPQVPTPPAAPAKAATAPLAQPEATPSRVADLVARGKAYRPLAELLIREIERALPGVAVTATGELVTFTRPRELAALQVTPRELKLALDLGERPYEAPLLRARMPGAIGRLGHMIVLNDARQVAAPLLELVREADSRANPAPPGAGPETE